jgi:hypothetical protein
MSMANSQKEIKSKSLVELAGQLEASIREAAREGKTLHEVEKNTFGYVLPNRARCDRTTPRTPGGW